MTGFLVVTIIILILIIIALYEVTKEQNDLITRQQKELDKHFYKNNDS